MNEKRAAMRKLWHIFATLVVLVIGFMTMAGYIVLLADWVVRLP